jgi:hypothetical protein
MAIPVTGRCFCGAVKFQFDHEPVATRACWCRDCQYLATGNAAINAFFKTAGLSLTGAVEKYVSTRTAGTPCGAPSAPSAGRRCSAKPTAGPT